MDEALRQHLNRIETGFGETGSVLHEQGETLRLIQRQLAEIVELLTPKDEEGGVPLDELLAHMIKQNAEQLTLARRLVEAMNRLERTLPAEVAASVLAGLTRR